MPDQEEQQQVILKGISSSPGICIGKAYIVDREGVDVVEKYYIRKKDVDKEKKRFKAAVKRAIDELRSIISNTPTALHQQTNILETHVVLLKDKMLYGHTLDTIADERVNAEWALKTVVLDIKSMFAEMEDDYFREREADVVHVSDRIMHHLVGTKTENIAKIDKRVILVANDLSPADTSQIQLERIKGFVTTLGGKASHTSIIARTLEIPAVQGVEDATRLISNDDVIVVNGTNGTVIVHPTEQTLVDHEEQRGLFEYKRAALTRDSQRPADTTDGFHLRTMGNIELPEEVVSVLSYGGEGVGLYRTEFQYMGRPDFPEESELFDKYKDVIEVMAPNPVTIRTLDINGDKAISSAAGFEEQNPALGLRGIRWCLARPDVFRTQLRAILRAAVYGSVRIMFPMISIYEELVQAKQSLDEAAESLEKDGIEYNRDIEVGILIEVPSAVIIADHLAKEVDFFSIGTNDLIQYTLAIDRGNKAVSHLFQPLDPSVIRMLKMLEGVAQKNEIKMFMCGEMAGYPTHLPVLLGLGMVELSMNPQSIPAVKRMARLINLEESRAFVDKLLDQTSANAVFNLIRDAYGDLLNNNDIH